MADIVIRGMEIPETCHECPFNVDVYTYDGGDNKCALDAWDGYSEQPKITRHPDCPLVPMPEGHGRLIDADALKKYWQECEEKLGPENTLDLLTYHDVLSEAVIYDLDKAPTIVPAEGGNDDA